MRRNRFTEEQIIGVFGALTPRQGRDEYLEKAIELRGAIRP